MLSQGQSHRAGQVGLARREAEVEFVETIAVGIYEVVVRRERAGKFAGPVQVKVGLMGTLVPLGPLSLGENTYAGWDKLLLSIPEAVTVNE